MVLCLPRTVSLEAFEFQSGKTKKNRAGDDQHTEHRENKSQHQGFGKPRITPVPNIKRTIAAIAVVIFESKIAVKARLKPESTDERKVLPCLISSLSLLIYDDVGIHGHSEW